MFGLSFFATRVTWVPHEKIQEFSVSGASRSSSWMTAAYMKDFRRWQAYTRFKINNGKERWLWCMLWYDILYALRDTLYQHYANICVKLCKREVLCFCAYFRFSDLIFYFTCRLMLSLCCFCAQRNDKTRWIFNGKLSRAAVIAKK